MAFATRHESSIPKRRFTVFGNDQPSWDIDGFKSPVCRPFRLCCHLLAAAFSISPQTTMKIPNPM